MSQADGPSFENELANLRARLEILERDHRQAVAGLRRDISHLELKTKSAFPEEKKEAPAAAAPPPLPPQPAAPPPPPDPAPVAIPEEELPALAPQPQPRSHPAMEGEKFEQQLGRVWLVRLGIALLVTGLVLLGNYAYQNWIRDLPAGARLAALFACAGLLIESGRRLAARPRLKNFGEVVLGGGLAFGYYCTFAAHHVERLRVIENPVAAALLLFAAAGAIGGVSWLRQARTTAVMAFVLASYSTMLQPIGWLSCVSSFLLAAGGVTMMLRPGWAGPGIASLVATYAAFFGWQFLGAAQSRLDDPAVLWFLPPVWLMFSLPGATGHFDLSLSDRARAWFTGANNAAFFLLFSAAWVALYGWTGYWQAPAIFGIVLVALGAAGRRSDRSAGGVNVAHGIALLSLALVLKLDGFQLALALAAESLLLALAFVKFRGRSELGFSVASGLGACSLVVLRTLGPIYGAPVPVWGAGLAALLVAAAAVAIRLGTERAKTELREMGRGGASLAFLAAVAAGIVGWCLRLPGEWPLPAATAVAVVLGTGYVFLGLKRRMPETAVGALAFLVAACFPLTNAESPAALVAAMVLALGGTWIWHRPSPLPDRDPVSELTAWLHSAFVAVTGGLFVWRLMPGHEMLHAAAVLAALVLTGTAIALRCHRLPPCAAVLALIAFLHFLTFREGWVLPAFLIVALSLAAAAILRLPAAARLVPGEASRLAGYIFRFTAFAAFCTGWQRLSPGYWGDVLAGTALLLAGAAWFLKRRPPLELAGLVVVAGMWLVFETINSPWREVAPSGGWRGAAVALAGIVLPLMARKAWAGANTNRKELVSACIAIGCGTASVWATQMLVWRHDWQAAAVLWSVLGFIAVTAGLWQRLVVFRQVGFALLALAIVKVFAVDVWDFTAFMRVVSFIVLGAALTVLGLFYNRFVPAMKRLLDEEQPGKERTPATPG